MKKIFALFVFGMFLLGTGFVVAQDDFYEEPPAEEPPPEEPPPTEEPPITGGVIFWNYYYQ